MVNFSETYILKGVDVTDNTTFNICVLAVIDNSFIFNKEKVYDYAYDTLKSSLDITRDEFGESLDIAFSAKIPFEIDDYEISFEDTVYTCDRGACCFSLAVCAGTEYVRLGVRHHWHDPRHPGTCCSDSG